VITSKTPLRISFFSGGSDIESFYKHEHGAALSCTIDKYIYVSVNHTPHTGIRTMHDTVDDANHVDQLQNKIIRESLRLLGLGSEITISSIADVRPYGAGLGSSSAFTVGLLNALTLGVGETDMDAFRLAEMACDVEINRCGYPIGRQDQYAAAIGGANLFAFQPEGEYAFVEVLSSPALTAAMSDIEDKLILVYSGRSRSANDILQRQSEEIARDPAKMMLVRKNRDRAYKAKQFLESGQYDWFGELLHEAWEDKKNIVSGMTDDYLDRIYRDAREAGAIGGKLLGAGGGGFFLFYAPPEKRRDVLDAVVGQHPCLPYDFKFTQEGSFAQEV